MDAFPPASPASDADEEARYGQMRSEPRDSMMLLATMRRQNRPEVQVKIRNLSSGGLMAEAPSAFLRGEPVEVELRGIGLVTGKVAWTAAGKIGVTFDWTVDPKAARKPVTPIMQQPALRPVANIWRPGLR